jgi:CubicO group peptidase (beta-lactamase class C family)
MSQQKTNSSWPLPTAKPEEAGFSSERLARIRPGLQKFIDQKICPNLVTLVARHGKVVYFDAQGFMDFESRKPVQKDTIYRMWSNTKPITGVATMICMEEGLLDLDDSVSKYIPAFKNPVVRYQETMGNRETGRGSRAVTPTVPADREITIRDCLRNTTGLPTPRNAPIQYLVEFKDIYTADNWLADPVKPLDIRKNIEALAKLPLDFQPGTQFVYQVGFPIVGIILEMVTGKTLDEFYRERIFKPLGMKDTSFYLPEDKLDRFPCCYRPVRDHSGWKIVITEKPETSEKVKGPPQYCEAGGGGGGVLSTAADYVRFAQMLLNGGELEGVRILGRKTVELMTKSHTAESVQIAVSGPGFGFGMGVGVYKGAVPPIMRSVGTFGWSGLAGTTFFADPKEDLICECFTQVLTGSMMPGSTYHEEFERLVYQSLI